LAKKTFHFLLEKRKFAKKTNRGVTFVLFDKRPTPLVAFKKRKPGREKQ